MDEGSARGEAVASAEDRRYPRYAVAGESSLSFFDLGLTRDCKVVDLSLEGCRVIPAEALPAGSGGQVEVVIKVEGSTFRFRGVVRWTGGGQAGIQFVDVIARRRADLEELIGEIASAVPGEAAKESSGRAQRGTAPAGADPEARGAPAGAGSAAKAGAGSDRRTEFRHRIETSAVLFLVRSGSGLEGRILDLSAGGCHIRFEERFAVDLYTRVEIEFQLRGQPFRLGGVIQRIVKDNGILHGGSVGVRFLDLSERKLEQVTELIAEIEQARCGG